MAVAAGFASAATLSWDFNDGLQGWTIVNTGTNTGQWIAPGDAPLLYTDGGTTNIYSQAPGGNVYLPGDSNGRTIALFDLAPWLVGGSTQSYRLRADVWIPNLRPLNFTYGYPSMCNNHAGISAYALNGGVSNDWGTHIGGRLDKGTQYYLDHTSDAWIQRRVDWTMEDTALPMDDWWDAWITMEIDWNLSSPGNVIARYYRPWQAYPSGPGWVTLYSGPIEATTWFTNPRQINRIGLGAYLKGDVPWTKSQFDNVVFESPDVIPEPAGLLLLSLGGLAVLRRRR